VKLFDPSGINIFSPPQPITGDLDLINNTLTVDPFLFFGFEWVTQSVELLGEGIHTRPDGSGGNISATVESGQAGAYIVIGWNFNAFPTFMVWDVASNANGAVYTAVDSDGDGVPGHALIPGPFPGFTAVYDFTIGEPPPGIGVSIGVGGGLTQECADIGGSDVSLTATIVLIGGAEAGSIEWFVDGEEAGTGEIITPFLTLGPHTVEVLATTATGEIDQDSVDVTIQDTTKPIIDVAFIDQNGEPVTTTSAGNHVTARITASDICDPNPETEGAAMPVYAVNDGDAIKIQSGKINTVDLPTTAIELSATATDESGNSTSGMAILSITH
jgi:hypothetical protein